MRFLQDYNSLSVIQAMEHQWSLEAREPLRWIKHGQTPRETTGTSGSPTDPKTDN
jgi:hypothetical protein